MNYMYRRRLHLGESEVSNESEREEEDEDDEIENSTTPVFRNIHISNIVGMDCAEVTAHSSEPTE